jgi:hypothetical protein
MGAAQRLTGCCVEAGSEMFAIWSELRYMESPMVLASSAHILWNYANPDGEMLSAVLGVWRWAISLVIGPYLLLMALSYRWADPTIQRPALWLTFLGIVVSLLIIAFAVLSSLGGYTGIPGPGCFAAEIINGIRWPCIVALFLGMVRVAIMTRGVARPHPGRRSCRGVAPRHMLTLLEGAVLAAVLVRIVALSLGTHGRLQEDGRNACWMCVRGSLYLPTLIEAYAAAHGYVPANTQALVKWHGSADGCRCPVSGQLYDVEYQRRGAKLFVVVACGFHHERSDPIELRLPRATAATQPVGPGP